MSAAFNNRSGIDSDRGRPVDPSALTLVLYSAIRLNRFFFFFEFVLYTHRLNRSTITRHFFPDVRLYGCAVVWALTGNYGMSVTC